MTNYQLLLTKPNLELKAKWNSIGIKGTLKHIPETSEVMFIASGNMPTQHIISKERFDREFTIID